MEDRLTEGCSDALMEGRTEGRDALTEGSDEDFELGIENLNVEVNININILGHNYTGL